MNRYEAWMCRISGRSWWEAMYATGKTLAEWDTLTNTLLTPLGRGASSRWEEVPKAQMVRLRLLCPNGQAGELIDPSREGHKFFQLKVGVRLVGDPHSHARAQLIGVVTHPDGDCVCYAWDVRSAQLIQFEDNIFAFRYAMIGRLSLEVQGLKL